MKQPFELQIFITIIVIVICHYLSNVGTCYELVSGGMRAPAQGWVNPCAAAKVVLTGDYGNIDFPQSRTKVIETLPENKLSPLKCNFSYLILLIFASPLPML